MLSWITLNCQVTIRNFPYSKCLGGSEGQGSTGLPVGSCPTGVFNFGTDRNRVLEKTLVSGIGNLFLINRVLSGIETPKDINRHFQTLHNKSWTLPRHPSDTPKHLLYGKCLMVTLSPELSGVYLVHAGSVRLEPSHHFGKTLKGNFFT